MARLERKGLLARTVCATDRRAYDLRLTPAGEALLGEAIADFCKRANFVTGFQGLSERDRQELTRIMGALHNELDRDFGVVRHSDT